ncbi:uncharacterized protein LOC106154444 [Lingula anatina]|uniref:Uncharacterized protein LOC106154444 n=1 Tax=Lingula anatina TaxID=7574 RepID=A0A1S3HDX4_LINAN|nr:uncharacterized protein LOC106154444 [Lingula anatina]|eukprot:XP_013384243.1 uncharacterized protein LOC106154444 [Lingula anatina]
MSLAAFRRAVSRILFQGRSCLPPKQPLLYSARKFCHTNGSGENVREAVYQSISEGYSQNTADGLNFGDNCHNHSTSSKSGPAQAEACSRFFSLIQQHITLSPVPTAATSDLFKNRDPQDIVSEFESNPDYADNAYQVLQYLYADLCLRQPETGSGFLNRVVIEDLKLLALYEHMLLKLEILKDLEMREHISHISLYPQFVEDPDRKLGVVLEKAVIQAWPTLSLPEQLQSTRAMYELSKLDNRYYLKEATEKLISDIEGMHNIPKEFHFRIFMAIVNQAELRLKHGEKNILLSLKLLEQSLAKLHILESKFLIVYLELMHLLQLPVALPALKYSVSVLQNEQSLPLVDQLLSTYFNKQCDSRSKVSDHLLSEIENVILNSMHLLDIRAKIWYAYKLSQQNYRCELIYSAIRLSFPDNLGALKDSTLEASDCLHWMKCLVKMNCGDDTSLRRIFTLLQQDYLERLRLSENWEESIGFLISLLEHWFVACVSGQCDMEVSEWDPLLRNFFSEAFQRKLEDGIPTHDSYVEPLLKIYGYLELQKNTQYTNQIPRHQFEIPVIRDAILKTQWLKLDLMSEMPFAVARAIDREVRLGTLPHFGLVYIEFILDTVGTPVLVPPDKIKPVMLGCQQTRLPEGWRRIAVRVMRHEDYTWDKKELIVPEACRTKVLEKLGFTVLHVPPELTEKWDLREFLEEQLGVYGWKPSDEAL